MQILIFFFFLNQRQLTMYVRLKKMFLKVENLVTFPLSMMNIQTEAQKFFKIQGWSTLVQSPPSENLQIQEERKFRIFFFFFFWGGGGRLVLPTPILSGFNLKKNAISLLQWLDSILTSLLNIYRLMDKQVMD